GRVGLFEAVDQQPVAEHDTLDLGPNGRISTIGVSKLAGYGRVDAHGREGLPTIATTAIEQEREPDTEHPDREPPCGAKRSVRHGTLDSSVAVIRVACRM